MKTRVELGTYLGEGNFSNRLGTLYKLDDIYCIDMCVDGEVVKTVSYETKSLPYHESVVENFVMGIIKL